MGVEIEFDEDAMKEIANGAMDNALDQGVDIECPTCGQTFTLSRDQMDCPNCGTHYVQGQQQ